jgi:iron complex outermembrane recepter protein
VYGNRRLAGLPPHVGSADLQVNWRNGTFAAAGADWTHGRTLVDHAGLLHYGGRTVTHARIGRTWARNWTAHIEVRNIFDRRSIASTAGVLDRARNPAATSIFLPAPGRGFSIGLEWRR